MVVPRLLMKKPAIPNHRKVVFPDGLNASAPNGLVRGAFAWNFFSILFFEVSELDCACAPTANDTRINDAIIKDLEFITNFIQW